MEILIVVIACAVTALFTLQPFQQGSQGFLLGLVLGPIGLAIAVIQRSNLRRDEQLAQHREIVYLLRRGKDEEIDRTSNAEQGSQAVET